MSRFEDDLKAALRPEEPSADFTERVMARIAAAPAQTRQEKSREQGGWRRRLTGFFQPPEMKWAVAGAIACLLILAAFGISRYREYQHRQQQLMAEIAEGERAKEQVMLAMRIAGAKLNVAQKKVQENSEK
jgi:hypothetical protein